MSGTPPPHTYPSGIKYGNVCSTNVCAALWPTFNWEGRGVWGCTHVALCVCVCVCVCCACMCVTCLVVANRGSPLFGTPSTRLQLMLGFEMLEHRLRSCVTSISRLGSLEFTSQWVNAPCAPNHALLWHCQLLTKWTCNIDHTRSRTWVVAATTRRPNH